MSVFPLEKLLRDVLSLGKMGFSEAHCQPNDDEPEYIDFRREIDGFGDTQAKDDRYEEITFVTENRNFDARVVHVGEDGDYWYETSDFKGDSVNDLNNELIENRKTAPKTKAELERRRNAECIYFWV